MHSFIRLQHADVLRFVDRDGAPPAAAAEARAYVRVDPARLDLDAAHEHADALDLLLVEVASDDYVFARLATELRRDAGAGPGALTLAGDGDLEGARALLDRYHEGAVVAADSARARAVLGWLYRMRSDRRIHDRARIRLRSRYLHWATLLMLVLAGAVAAALVLAADRSVDLVCLAAAAGALGGSLSGAFTLRDNLSRLQELRAFSPVLAIQPVIGVTAGLVLYAGGSASGVRGAWGPTFLLAFAAGFSQPFFLSVLERAGAAK
jgi:hypothetical protein